MGEAEIGCCGQHCKDLGAELGFAATSSNNPPGQLPKQTQQGHRNKTAGHMQKESLTVEGKLTQTKWPN